MDKRKRVFYTADDDLLLLREVVGQNPFEDRSRWSLIKKNIEKATGKDFKEKGLRDRVSLLVEKFEEKKKNEEFKSGVEEEVTELDDLLHSILLLIQDFKTSKTRLTPYEKGFQKRETASNQAQTESLNIYEEIQLSENVASDEASIQVIYVDDNGTTLLENNDNTIEKTGNTVENNGNTAEKTFVSEATSSVISRAQRYRRPGKGGGILTPSRVRNSIKQSSLKYLETKNERWYKIRCRELDLEEKKFESECEERKRRLQMEEDRLELEKKNSRLI